LCPVDLRNCEIEPVVGIRIDNEFKRHSLRGCGQSTHRFNQTAISVSILLAREQEHRRLQLLRQGLHVGAHAGNRRIVGHHGGYMILQRGSMKENASTPKREAHKGNLP
jgi:hypothetical protein